jgi:hypothetical protein
MKIKILKDKMWGMKLFNNGVYQAGIDIGLDNLLSVVSDSPGLRSFIVSGKELKSYNRFS